MLFNIVLGLTAVLVGLQLFIFLKSLFFYKVLYPKFYRPRFQEPAETDFPSVHIFVASKGLSPDLEKNIRSYAEQDYPGSYQVTVVTESARDPGTPLIRSLAEEYAHLRHITAGLATRCSQKNHNLLAGMRDDHSSDIFAFVDADVRMGKLWLRQIVRPLHKGKNWIATGLPSHTLTSHSYAHLIHAALTAYQAKIVMSFGAVWGGSYAIWRETFDQLDIRTLWETSVVDDIGLFQRVQHHNLKHWWGPNRIHLMPVPDLDLYTKTSISTISGVIQWFIRQVLYIKYHRRPIWHLAVWGNFANMLMTFLAPLLLLFPGEPMLFKVGMVGLSFLMFLWVINISLLSIRRQDDCSLLSWSRLFVFGDLVANIALLATLFTNQLHWSDITYHVAKDGSVTQIEHPDGYVAVASSEISPP